MYLAQKFSFQELGPQWGFKTENAHFERNDERKISLYGLGDWGHIGDIYKSVIAWYVFWEVGKRSRKLRNQFFGY